MTKNVTIQWHGRKTLEQKKIRSGGSYPFNTTQVSKAARITYEGEFSVEIDIEGLIKKITLHAAHNSSGKAAYLAGLVRAKRLTAKEVSREEKEYPIPQGYQEVA